MSMTKREAGQAAVETAITLPMLVFTLLGILQMTMTYHARILNEYAAFKAARAASVFRGDCKRIKQAALMALIPSMGGGGGTSASARYANRARTSVPFNLNRAGNPIVLINYSLENIGPDIDFDAQLVGRQRNQKVRVQLAYFYEYRIPFASEWMARFWLAGQTGYDWANGGRDPIMPVSEANRPAGVRSVSAELVNLAETNILSGVYAPPLVSTFAMRMMSQPLPQLRTSNRCR
jgi:hypothetical protein